MTPKGGPKLIATGGPKPVAKRKSGLGYSFGVKGARIGTGPRGNYIHMGRYGLYYRQYFNTNTPHQNGGANEIPYTPVESVPTGTVIPTADVARLQDSSAEDLLNYIREQHRKPLIAPWVSAVAGILIVGTIAKEIAIEAIAASLVLAVITHFVVRRFDMGRKRVVLHYRLDETAQAKYGALSNAVKALSLSQRIWRIITRDRSGDTKYTAGAGELVNRQEIAIRSQAPRGVEVDLPIWSMMLGGQSLYFFPDRMLVYQGSEIGAVPYSELSTTFATTPFVESDGVPNDARVVGTTWRYVNKGGGPDRRFANNPQIPVAEYAQIRLRSKAGLNFILHCSNVAASRSFVEGMSQYCSVVLTTQIDRESRLAIPDGAEPTRKDSALEGWGWVAGPILLTGMLLAIFLGPRGNYLQALSSPPPTDAPTAVERPLPPTRMLRQKGSQIIVAVPAGTTNSDLLRLLGDMRSKIEASEFSQLGINAEGEFSPASGALFVFKTDGVKIPRPLVQSDATLKWHEKLTTATILQPDGTRTPAFASASHTDTSTKAPSAKTAKERSKPL